MVKLSILGVGVVVGSVVSALACFYNDPSSNLSVWKKVAAFDFDENCVAVVLSASGP